MLERLETLIVRPCRDDGWIMFSACIKVVVVSGKSGFLQLIRLLQSATRPDVLQATTHLVLINHAQRHTNFHVH